MDREWKIEVIGVYLTAVVNYDDRGLSAVITGEIVDAPQAGDSDLPPRVMSDERYSPETVRAQSLGELRWAVEEKIENDVGQVINWSDDESYNTGNFDTEKWPPLAHTRKRPLKCNRQRKSKKHHAPEYRQRNG